MSKIKVIKLKGYSYEKSVAPYLESFESTGRITEELAASEPDLVAYEEPYQSPELAAAIEVLHEGGLKRLTARQQQIFQLHIVEGKTLREIGKLLGVDNTTIGESVTRIGEILRELCEKKLGE